MTKKRSKTIEERVEEILNEDPRERHERVLRMLAERIAHHEARLEEEREARARHARGDWI